MNEAQTRLKMLCDWLTMWLGKSVSSSDDWFCRSAAMAYRHFVDLAAKEYTKDDLQLNHCHSLHAEFTKYYVGHLFGTPVDLFDRTLVDLDKMLLRIEFSSCGYSRIPDEHGRKILEEEDCKGVKMHWMDDEFGCVFAHNDNCYPTDTEMKQELSKILKTFGGGESGWLLARLRICCGDNEVITYERQ